MFGGRTRTVYLKNVMSLSSMEKVSKSSSGSPPSPNILRVHVPAYLGERSKLPLMYVISLPSPLCASV